MPTFTYAPGDRVTLAPGGDLTVIDNGTSTTFSKSGGTKTVTRTPPDPSPSAPENAITNQTRPNGDVVQQYTDLTATPPVTVKLLFHPSGDIDMTVSRDEIQVRTQIRAANGARHSHTWKQGTPEPTMFPPPQLPASTTKNPPPAGSPSGSSAPSGGGRKPSGKKAAKGPQKKGGKAKSPKKQAKKAPPRKKR